VKIAGVAVEIRFGDSHMKSEMLLVEPICLTDICKRKMRILLIDSAVQLKRWIDM
jgi:hypothetical protein